MAKNNKRRGKHIPQRTCVGCRQVQSKRQLVRIVRTPEGVLIEAEQRLSGRGAYLHAERSCWEKGLHTSLEPALRTNLSTEDVERLQSFMDTLPQPEDQEKIKDVKA